MSAAFEKMEADAFERFGSKFLDVHEVVSHALSRGFGPTMAATQFSVELAISGEIGGRSNEVALGTELLGVAVDLMSMVGTECSGGNEGGADGKLTLTADYALSTSLELAQRFGPVEIQRFARATQMVFEGAMAGIEARSAGPGVKNRLLESLEAEFGTLHALAARHGALNSGRIELADGLSNFARDLGVAFRIAEEIHERSESASAIELSATDCRLYLEKASSALESITSIDTEPLIGLLTFIADSLDASDLRRD